MFNQDSLQLTSLKKSGSGYVTHYVTLTYTGSRQLNDQEIFDLMNSLLPDLGVDRKPVVARKGCLKEEKEPAYLEFIRRKQPDFDSLTIENCHGYLVENHLDFTQIPHAEFCKKPTRFRDEIAFRVLFNFRRTWNGISLSLYKRDDGYFMKAGMHFSSLGYIGTYVITESHYKRLFNLVHGSDYRDRVNELHAEAIDFVDFSQRLDEATLRVYSDLSVSGFFKEYLGLDDTYIKKIVSDIFFWVDY